MNKSVLFTMKLSLLVIMAVFVAKLPSITNAQTIIDTTAATGISNTIDSAPGINKASLLNKIRADVNNKAQNVKNNQGERNELIQKLQGSSTPPFPPRLGKPGEGTSTQPRIGGGRVEQEKKFGSTTPKMNPPREDKPRLASTTPGVRRDGYENNGKAMIIAKFHERKLEISKQLNVALRNIVDLRKRINSRIEKEQTNGKNMTKANELLVIADAKIVLATNSLNTLKNYRPASTTAATINLDEARKLINDAQKSVKDAHKALNDVVVEIAHALGLKLGGNNPSPRPSTSPAPATSISPSISPSPAVAPTTSPTTSPSSNI